jgi:hypothetical protein
MIEVLTSGRIHQRATACIGVRGGGTDVGTAGSERLLFIVYPLEYAPQQQIELLSPEARSMEQLVPRAGDEIVERVRCARSVPGVWTANTSNRNFLADDRRKICLYQRPYTPLHNLVPLGNWRVHLITLLHARRLQVITLVTSVTSCSEAHNQPACASKVSKILFGYFSTLFEWLREGGCLWTGG